MAPDPAAGAVGLLADACVRAVTPGGEWLARLPGESRGPAGGGSPWSREALVAGLVPGTLLGWSWPDRLRHAVALGAASSGDGQVDLAAYERLVALVQVQPPGGLPGRRGRDLLTN